MLRLRIILLAIVVSAGAVLDAVPLRAQLLPLPFPTRTKKSPAATPSAAATAVATITATPLEPTLTSTATPPPAPTTTRTATPTATRTATPLPAATRTPTVTRTPTPVATSAALPDMVPAIDSVHLDLDASVASGDFAEGCAEAMTGVDLLRFSAVSSNIGNADLVLGDPGCPSPCTSHPLEVCADPDFVCSPAEGHNHAHYNNYARYELLDEAGGLVVVGHKQGYCLRDTNCASPVYTCTNQGISAGCADTYDYTLGCQYLDVTGIPAGNYLLRVVVDPLNRIPELSDANNVAEQMVTITRPGVATPTRTATPTATRTMAPVPTVTPIVTATPPPFATVTATPPAVQTATPPAVQTATPLPTATPAATVTPLATTTPAATATLPATPVATPTPTPELTPLTGPSATPTPAGGLPNGALASACQRAILKAGKTLMTRTLSGLDACASAVSSCEAPRRRTAGCRDRATASCASATAKVAAARAAFIDYVTERCEGAGDAELLAAAGLAFTRRAEACSDDFGVGLGDVAGMASCLTRQHVCRTGTLQEIEEPRTGARLRQGAALAADLCITDLGGADPNAPDVEDARPLEVCTRAVRRAGRSFARHRLATLQSCLAAHASCFKPSANPAACERRAEEVCTARKARVAPDLARLIATVQRSCSALDFARLRAEAGANLDAIAPRCAALGIPTLTSLADYEQCVARQHACAVDELLRFQAPRADDWIGDWPAPAGACPAD